MRFCRFRHSPCAAGPDDPPALSAQAASLVQTACCYF
eukprot:gene10508-9397_t